MKFRAKFLSLAAVSALAATAFVMTGCGSDDSSSASSTSTSSTGGSTTANLTAKMVKGLWAGVPYTRKDNSTGATESLKTAAVGQFKYRSGDNVSFHPGLGVNATYTNVNGLTNNATKFMYLANSIEQNGVVNLTTTDKQNLMANIATVYQILGVDENATNTNSSRVAEIAAALDRAYSANPGYYNVKTSALVNSMNTTMTALFTALGDDNIKAANGSTITAGIAASMAATFNSNRTVVDTELNKIINSQGAAATLANSPAAGDLVNALVLAAYANNTLGKTLAFGGTAQSGWINGSILQNASSAGASQRMIFTDLDYTEGKEVSDGSTAYTYMATMVPYDILGNVSSSGKFNVTIKSKTFQFALGSARPYGWYNVSGKYGYFTTTALNSTVGSYAINMFNTTTAANSFFTATDKAIVDAMDIGNTTVFSTLVATSQDTGNKTIAFKQDPNMNGRTFIGYYWDKMVAIAKIAESGTIDLGNANATLSGAQKDTATTMTK